MYPSTGESTKNQTNSNSEPENTDQESSSLTKSDEIGKYVHNITS